MPRIFDNIELSLQQGLAELLPHAQACSFCVGYLHLRGWASMADFVEHLQGGDEHHACRILVGMQRPPEEESKQLAEMREERDTLDGPTIARLRHRIIQSFTDQLAFGVPTAEAEHALQCLAAQLRARKVLVKLFLRHPLHAKLYLVQRNDPVAPLVAFVGSSNLTLAGLARQGELNVDVLDQDAARKLLTWFDARWHDKRAYEITDDLAQIIEESWARPTLVRPYLVYLRMAYELSSEARQGEHAFRIPSIFAARGTPLLPFQETAVSLAAHYVHRHGGVLLGDVVGLGKTLMATAIMRIFQEDSDTTTLVICPPNLKPLWERHLETYEINGRIISIGKVVDLLNRDDAPRYRLVVIDESHNLRNREGQRYRVIRDYIQRHQARVVLVTATPYNKQFTDLSNQLRLFLNENEDLHVRPERFFQWWAAQGRTEDDFVARFQTSPCSLRAFEQSTFPDDWRDVMRLFLVRRTRQFIMKHYASFDQTTQRYYVELNGSRKYFPVRVPKCVRFALRENDPSDQYARLFSDDVVKVIENLQLPRYGLAQFLAPNACQLATPAEQRILENLTRAGRRLIGFCRTNLFKRVESSGHSFLLSVRRHIARNMVTLYALESGQPVPIGTQHAALLDPAISDSEDDYARADDDDLAAAREEPELSSQRLSLSSCRARAAQIYSTYAQQFHDRFDWLRPTLFQPALKEALLADTKALLGLLDRVGAWQAEHDAKLAALCDLLTRRHPRDKVLIFTQFADTAAYLHTQLRARGLDQLAVVTNATPDPVALARRFSPSSNRGLAPGQSELRLLIATDVLAEGQNLQDAHIVVNYDLPWAIIRLIQRAGRVDRIGQQHDTILVYSFLPADGVERIIRLRKRLFERLTQNQEVIGTDESFLGEDAANTLRDLYTEKAGTLDDDHDDEDIDLASLALQVWNSASPDDQKQAIRLPPVISATRALSQSASPSAEPPGLIVYLRYPTGTDLLLRVDNNGNLVSHSPAAILRAAACPPDTTPLPHPPHHFSLLQRCLELALKDQASTAGHLGSLHSIRRSLWHRLTAYRDSLRSQPLLAPPHLLPQLDLIIDRIWHYPLTHDAQQAISRQLRLGISDQALLELLLARDADGKLCQIPDQEPSSPQHPQIICSLGLLPPSPPPP